MGLNQSDRWLSVSLTSGILNIHERVNAYLLVVMVFDIMRSTAVTFNIRDSFHDMKKQAPWKKSVPDKKLSFLEYIFISYKMAAVHVQNTLFPEVSLTLISPSVSYCLRSHKHLIHILLKIEP